MQTAQNVSGVILVSCEGDACKDIVKKAKLQIRGITDAFPVQNKESSDKVDVIINVDAQSKTEIRDIKDSVLAMDGVKAIKYRITQ